MEKGPNLPYFKLKKSPRCQIFSISSRRSPRIQRDPYVFLFSYMVYHQIWLIFLLASHHFVYATKLNKRENKKTKKKTLVSGDWGREEKRKLLATVCRCTAGGSGEVSTCLEGGQDEAPTLVLSKRPWFNLRIGIFTKKHIHAFYFLQILVPVFVLVHLGGPGWTSTPHTGVFFLASYRQISTSKKTPGYQHKGKRVGSFKIA